MRKISQIIYYLSLLALVILNAIVLSIYQINDLSFYLFTSSLLLIFPFISLFYILFLNIKKIEYKMRKYDEAGLIAFIISGVILLFIYGKINNYVEIFFIIGIVLFIIIAIIFLTLNILKGKINGTIQGGKK